MTHSELGIVHVILLWMSGEGSGINIEKKIRPPTTISSVLGRLSPLFEIPPKKVKLDQGAFGLS